MNLVTVFKAHHIDWIPATRSEIRVPCPQCRRRGHPDRIYKLYINTDKNVGHCKRCGFAGGRKKILQLFGITKLAPSTTPSLEDLRNEFRRTRERRADDLETPPPQQVVPAWSDGTARAHLQSRGFNRARAERYGFLYCTGGYFQDRLIAPVFDGQGRYRTFVARALGDRCQCPTRKYLYPKGCAVSRLLYGLHSHTEAKRQRFAVLVEGLFDAIHLAPYGLGLFGTSCSDRQVELLRGAGITTVVLCYDHDRGQVARDNVAVIEQRVAQKLRQHFTVGVIHLPTRGSDPTDYPKAQLLEWAERSLS